MSTVFSPLILSGMGPVEILVIIIFGMILIVGAKKLPELARAAGRSISEFQRGRQEIGFLCIIGAYQ